MHPISLVLWEHQRHQGLCALEAAMDGAKSRPERE